MRCPGPVTRREFMRVGGLTLGGLTLSDLMAHRAAAGQANSNTSVILLYQYGGPSQLETYDLKPNAPSEYRSVFEPISTNVPGMDICELFPLQAKLADKIALVRSLHHTMSSHNDGGIEVLTGKTPPKPDPTSGALSEHPDFGNVTSKIRGFASRHIPPYVAIPKRMSMTRPTYLGLHHGGFAAGDPTLDNYTSPFARLRTGVDGHGLADRRTLLRDLDRIRAGIDFQGNIEGTDRFHQMAFDLLTNPRTAEAFDIASEDESLRDRYGRNLWGQSCLLARRLAEAGVGAISVLINTPKTGQEFTNWDDHILNARRPGHFGKYMRVRLPYLDQCLSALIEDIYRRNLEQRIMVVMMGEFGRTPRLSVNSNGVGRNHWPQAYTVLFSGGGLRTGQVVGATNSKAEYPIQRPYSPKDVLATIYRHLGIDFKHTFQNHSGRPIPILPWGAPIGELV